MSSNPGHAQGKAGQQGGGCQAVRQGGRVWCPQGSEAFQCQEHPSWVQRARDTIHPRSLTLREFPVHGATPRSSSL